MRKINFFLIAIVVALFPTIGIAQKIQKEQFTADGKKRTYYLYVPASVKAETPAPMVVLLHGSGRNGLSLAEKWKELADKEGLIVLAPDSMDSGKWDIPGDGPGVLHQLIEAIKTKHPVNPKRVYLFGHSGGAIFGLAMGLYESEYFAAVAAHAGALRDETTPLLEVAKRKVPIYLVVGTKDEQFPLATVRAARDSFNAKGFPVQLNEISDHDHWYYDLAPKINEGVWQFLKGHTLAADPRYEQYSFKSSDPTSRKAVEQYNKGMEMQRAGNVEGAITAYTKAIEIDGRYAAAYNNRGIARMGQSNFEAAVADFSRAIELEPSDVSYNNRANAYYSLKKFTESIADYTEAIKIKPSAAAYANRGLTYEQTGQQALGLADYDAAIKLDPSFGRAYALRGLVSLRTGKAEEGKQDFRKAFELDASLRQVFEPILKQLGVTL